MAPETKGGKTPTSLISIPLTFKVWKTITRLGPLPRIAWILVKLVYKTISRSTIDEPQVISDSTTESDPHAARATSSLCPTPPTSSVDAGATSSTAATPTSVAAWKPTMKPPPSSAPSPRPIPTNTKDGIAHNQAVLENRLNRIQAIFTKQFTKVHQKLGDLIHLGSLTHHYALQGASLSAAEQAQSVAYAAQLLSAASKTSKSKALFPLFLDYFVYNFVKAIFKQPHCYAQTLFFLIFHSFLMNNGENMAMPCY